jgi:hypothetical protein
LRTEFRGGWLTPRLLLAALLLLAGLAAPAQAQTAAPRTLVLAGFELLEDHPAPELAPAHQRRLAALQQQLHEGLAREQLYTLVDNPAAQAAIERLRAGHAHLLDCPGCAQEIGQAAGAELVLVGWVQKVSQLILNINIELRETASDRVLLSKSVDLRGNTDESWQRGLRFMLRDWAERRAANPQYGR